MPIKKNAKKALRQSLKRAVRNKTVKAEIGSLRIKFRKAIDSVKKNEALEAAKIIGQKVDKAVSKKILKKNTAARIKSRMMKKVNAIK
ncbi:MAG: 30S ribosomal protein S20 [Candidatus Uhrbacteria bacterium GW2011_GWF2_44_350]|uniref:Small ribosomal subunit protein bS20 n=1 Tax=Candidatus Uhrbacteria bacterium GW2011_GWF2_44_350 TaxID=1619000 RepID=A0A0G1JD67_9BACT|nr:MAG: 30S ribosomal protein S20 [Candidatus Uhrbacteria bacterium GW2011_GWF2_44_350]